MAGPLRYCLLTLVNLQVPPVADVEFNSEMFYQLEKEGLEVLTHCGFVLVAGGLGERLGYNDIKIGLPIETFTNLPFIGYYIKKILSIQVRFEYLVYGKETIQGSEVSFAPSHYDVRE